MRPAEQPDPSLQARLEAVLGGAARGRTVIASASEGRRRYAAIGCEGPAAAFRTGCVTKLLLAALVERKLARRVGYDEPVRRLLGITRAHPLGETTPRHLLEHTHGLDDSDMSSAPVRPDGRIDVDALLLRLARRRCAAPGEIYSYSSAGAFILASMLETLEQRPFAVLLRDDLLTPLGIRTADPQETSASGSSTGAPPAATRVCPATGAGMSLTVAGLMTFVETVAPESAAELTPLPGWHPLERGIRLGWKCYGDGWVGHQSVWPGASLLVAADPASRSALVVASEDHPAAVVAAKVLARERPWLAPSLPKRSPRVPALEIEAYRGRYASAAERLDVLPDESGLGVRCDGGGYSRLIRAAGELFFLETTGASRAFVEFLEPRDCRFLRLWDGRHVLRRQDR